MLHQNLIAGEWIEGVAVNRDLNPSNLDDVVGEYARADGRQAETAIDAAHEAFKTWSRATPEERSDVLDRIGTEILARKDEIGRLLVARGGQDPAGRHRRDGAGRAHLQVLRRRGAPDRRREDPVGPAGVEVEITREPEGVVGIITPWNFPVAIPAWKIAPALAYGNCVVFKPADLVPGCGWALADVISRSGIPAGVFNLVMGSGSQVGNAIVRSPKVRAVSFTGSVDTGRKVAADCVARGAKVQLEMGGKNPMIVMDDADLGIAVGACVNSAFFSTGQRCTASSRLIVQSGIHDKFVDAVGQKLATLKVDDALKAGTDIGPVVSQDQLDQDLSYVDIGRHEGARLVVGGERLNRETPGYYMAPALFVDTSNDMRINREEIFGPVASVIRVKDYEEAVAVANDTPFGLSSGICTTSLKYASDFKRRSAAGMVMVNLPTAGVDYHVPFGGRKGSSYGPREQGAYAREFYTSVKTAYTLP